MNTNSDSPPSKLPRTVKFLGWASFLNDVASEMIYTQLPHFLINVLGGNKVHLGLIEGTAESAAALIKLWSGARSDRSRQRKGFVVFGYSLAALSRPLTGIITAPWQLFVLRVVDRVGKGIRTSPRDAMIADVTDPSSRGRAFGFHRGMDHLGAALGPLLATGFLTLWPGQLRAMFLASLVPGLAVMLLALFLRDKPTNPPSEKSSVLTLAPFDRDFRIFLVALLLFTLGNSSDMFLLVRAGERGISPNLLPVLWCVFHVVKSGGNMLAGRLVDYFGPRILLVIGWMLYAVVYLLFAFVTAAYQIWFLFGLYAIYYSLAEPAEKTLVANLVGPARKGLAFGWFNLIVGVTALPASILFGWLYEQFGAAVAFGSGSGLAVAAILLLFTMPSADRPSRPGPVTSK